MIKFLNLIKSSIYYDVEKIPNGFNLDFKYHQRLLRWLIFLIAAPISLLTWLALRILSWKYKISIYVLPTFRPGIASMYLSTIEPICRELEHSGTPKHFTILVNPGEEISQVLTKSYEPHFSLYLDDRRKFARLLVFLIPQKGLDKIYVTGKREFDRGWILPPSKNYAGQGIQIPRDLQKLCIEPRTYILFVHPSTTYYKKRFPQSYIRIFSQSNLDLDNYEQPLARLVQNGLQIIRVGTDTDDLPDSFKNLPIIDYANGKRNEASELWLYENCKFLVSVANGAFWFARRFNRPTIITDSGNFVSRYFSTFFTPYLIEDTSTNELLSFRQMISCSKTINFGDSEKMRGRGLRRIQNSQSTLIESINETLDYSNGITHNDSAANELLTKYSRFCQESDLVFNVNSTRPTISFLRRYSHLLD